MNRPTARSGRNVETIDRGTEEIRRGHLFVS